MKHYSVLHIEDNKADQLLFRESAKEFKFSSIELDQVFDITSAEKKLEENFYDLVILDLGLPDGKGVLNVKYLLSLDPELNIVVYSGDNRIETSFEALKLGANDFIIKNEAPPIILEKSISFAIERRSLHFERDTLRKALSKELQNDLNKHVNIDQGSELNLSIDHKLQIKTCSHSSFDLLGFMSSELINESLATLLVPEEVSDFEKFLGNLLANKLESKSQYQHHLIHSNGAKYFMSSDFRVERDEVNTIINMVSNPINNNNEFLKALNKAKEEFQALYDASPGGIMVTDFESGKIQKANAQFCSLFHFREADIINKTTVEIGLWRDEPTRRMVMNKLRKGRTHKNLLIDLYDSKGNKIPCLIQVGIIKTSENKRKVISVILDNRKQSEQLVKLREAKIESDKLIEEIRFTRTAIERHAILLETDLKGNMSYVNEMFCDISGYSKEELLGENIRILKSGEHNESFYKDLWSTIGKGKVWNGEVCNRHKDGSLYWLQTTIIPRLDPISGKPESYLTLRTDITNLMQTKERLLESETNLQNTINSAPHEIWSVDTSFCFTSLNKVFKENMQSLYKLDLKEGMGLFEQKGLPENHEEIWKSRFELAFEGESKAYMDTWFSPNKPNEIRTKSVFISPTINADGKVSGANVFAEDITLLANRTKEIERLRRNTQALINSTPDHIWSIDPAFRLLSANDHFIKYWSSQLNESIEIGDLILSKELSPERQRKWLEIYEKALGGEEVQVLFEENEEDSAVILSIHLYPIFNSNNVVTGVACYSFDATERLTYLRMVEKQNQSLKEIAWLQSHVLRAPLARILGLVDLMESESDKWDPMVNDYLGFISSAAQELDRVVHEITDKTQRIDLKDS